MKGVDLKNSILQMAVQGKLVPQDPNDEPASVLLERIREQRRQLISEGKIKASKGGESVIFRGSDGKHYEKRVDAKGWESEPICIEDEIPFEIPESWEWVRLGSAYNFIDYRGKTPHKSPDGVRLVTASNVRQGYMDYTREEYISEEEYESRQGRGISKAGDLFFTTEAPMGYCAVNELDRCSAGQRVITFQNYSETTSLNNVLFRDFILSPVFQDQIMAQATGTTAKGIKAAKLVNLLLPIPPINEQQRIAASLAKLLPHLENYDTLEAAREQLDTEFPDRLRKSILQMAVQGKLVPQDPNDEPASVLLERIREQRRQLIAEGKIKAPKSGASIIYRGSDGGYYEKREKGTPEPVCVPFDIPETWEWTRIKTLGEIIGGGTPKTSDKSLWANNTDGISWITPADMKNVLNQSVSHGERYISKEGLQKSSAQLLPEGSVIMSSRAPIGYLAIAANSISTNQGFKSIVPIIFEINRWIILCLEALMDDIKARSSGTTFKEISGTEFGETLIPLPPFEQQQRITDIFKKACEIVF